MSNQSNTLNTVEVLVSLTSWLAKNSNQPVQDDLEDALAILGLTDKQDDRELINAVLQRLGVN